MSTAGNKGKFGERLKKILFFKKKKINEKEPKIEVEDSNNIYINFVKVMAAIPGLVYDHVVDTNIVDEKKETEKRLKIKVITKGQDVKNISKNLNKEIGKEEATINLKPDVGIAMSAAKPEQVSKKKRIEKRNLINAISIDKTFEKQENKTSLLSQNNETDDRIKELEKSIINLIKKDLIKIVNEMEMLQSELYILSEVNGESKVLKDCQRELDSVKAMICKIDKLKEQYDFLKDNYDFEYLLEIDNDDIVDKIIELKDSFGKSELKNVAEDYKLLEVYKYLYLKIDDLQEKTVAFEEEKVKEINKLKERDIDFEKLKQDVYNVDSTNRNYESFVNNQNDLLQEIEKNVHKINSYEEVNYHLKGFGALFKNTFKYFGLLMVSPLKGIIPSIATETLITGNLIKNLYNNLEWKEEKKMVYTAIDYASMINNAICDLETTSNIVDATLDDIVHLKMKYNDQFKKYQGDFLEYREIMQKINDMENKILGNKIKIEMMKKRALEQKRANDKKLTLVRELNEKK